MRALSIVGLTAAFLARCGQDTASTANHIAPIAAGAIPEQIGGCDKGCEKSNRFLQWQSYLAPLVEIHRKQSKCASVEWVTVDIDSDPDNPQFYVTCKNNLGHLYNTFYSKSQIDAGKTASSEPVSRAKAVEVCKRELMKLFPENRIVGQEFYVAPNGSARVTYDIRWQELTGKLHA